MADVRSNHLSYGGGGGDRTLASVTNCSSGYPEPYTNPPPPQQQQPHRSGGKVRSSSKSSTVGMKSSWSFNDPEVKRRKRVMKYKSYAVEGKVKASFGKGFRWIRNKCSAIVYGY